jgi:RNA polymerase sigma-70 factor (ECF subfamily)
MTDNRPRALRLPTRSSSGVPAPEDPDAALLHRIGDGDESALAALYDRWFHRVHAIAFWILGDDDDAEDVVEETFWQAWRTAGRFDSRRASAPTWLTMIARSRALDRLRAQRRRIERTAAGASTLLEEFEQGGAPATLQPESSEAGRHIAEALGSIPVEQRQVLELAFFQGLSHAEIAAHMGQPLGTIKTRIRLAMDKLRGKLGSLRDQMV